MIRFEVYLVYYGTSTIAEIQSVLADVNIKHLRLICNFKRERERWMKIIFVERKIKDIVL